MLEDGVAERIKTLLRSDMPPVQFKLLGTLRMLVDGQGDITQPETWQDTRRDKLSSLISLLFLRQYRQYILQFEINSGLFNHNNVTIDCLFTLDG